MSSLYKDFRAWMKRQKFVEAGENILVGNSGGVDSMVLTDLLRRLQKELSFRLHVGHVNYRLRGEESLAGEQMVRDFAKRFSIPCYVTAADLGGSEGENFQKKAREFRYHFFSEVALQIGVLKIMTAHHREDQVETILAQLLRGSSLKGLAGMTLNRLLHQTASGERIFLLRPLLSFSKEMLIDYARDHRILFVEDSSNATDQYWRNQLRHQLLPVLQNLRPKAFEKIEQFGLEMGELAAHIKEEAEQWLGIYAKKEEGLLWLPRHRWSRLPKILRLEVLYQAAFLWRGTGQNLKRDHLSRCEQIGFGEKGEGTYSLPSGILFARKGNNLLFCDRLPTA